MGLKLAVSALRFTGRDVYVYPKHPGFGLEIGFDLLDFSLEYQGRITGNAI